MATLAGVRATLTDSLTDALPGWALFPSGERVRDTVTEPTAFLTRTAVTKLAAAPLGFYENEMTLTVISPNPDSEDALDDLLDEFLEALDEVANVRWSNAQRAVYGSSNPAYQITITVHSNRKN
jgi:hypothetical protein